MAERSRDSLTLVVPFYQEARRLPRYFDELLTFIGKQPTGSELIFVDDGSLDDSRVILEQLMAEHPGAPVRMLRREHRGKGAAVRAGLEAAQAALAGFCDLDLSTSLTDIEVLADIARDEPVLAIGSRDMPESDLAGPEGQVREFLGRAYNRVVQLTLVPGIVDTQCGAKVARTEIWRRVLPACQEDGFAWDVEAIAVARGLGIDVREIPVSWRHDPDSKVHVARDGVRMLTALPRISRHVRRVTASPTGAAAGHEVFDDRNAAALGETDASHWWFRSKAQLVSTALRRLPGPTGWLLDAGAGSGGVTAQIVWDSRRKVIVEGSTVLSGQAATRHALAAVDGLVGDLPIADGSVAVVCLLDVIEHLDHPEAALAEARRVLAPGGRLVVTVPAHPGLWSAADEQLGHKRRYTRRLTRRQVEAEGFRVQYCSHIFSWLVAPVWAKRRTRPGGGAELGLDVASPAVDRTAALLTTLEAILVARVSLPVGTSNSLCRRASVMRIDQDSATREPEDLEIDVEADASDTPADDRATRWLYYATGAAALVSIASAGILAVVHHWVPVGDDAFFAVRAHDVFTAHPPLLGTWTSASASARVNMNNPGPLFFDALALPTAIFGSINAGIAVGVALVNLLCAIGIGIVARREGGYVVGTAAFAIVAVLAWTLGSVVLIDATQPGALLFPLLLAVMLSWGVARDDLALLPWLVGVASFILQTYVTYVFLMAFLGVWAVACMLLRLRASHGDREQLKRVRKVSLIAVVVGVLCWLQPTYQQFFGDGPGNFSQLWKAVRAPAKTFGPDVGTRLMADVVSLPPFWFRPSYHNFLAVRYVPESSLPVAIVTLLILAAVLAVIARVALRSTRDVVGTAAATALVALLAGVITAGRIPIGLFGVSSSHTYRWLWPLGAFCTFVLLIALIQYARHLVKPVAMMAGLAVIAVVFTALNLPTTDQNPDTTTDAIPAARDIGRQMAVLKGKGPLVADVLGLRFPEVYSAYTMAALQHYGVDFKVNEEITEYQVGHFRHFDGSNARGAVMLRDGDQVDLAPPNSERVAVHYGLNPSDRAEMTTLQGEIAEMMNDGTITLTDGGRYATSVGLARPLPTDPAAMAGYVQSDDFVALVRLKALNLSPDAKQKVDRYGALHTEWLRKTVAVYLAPLADLP